MSYSFYKRRIDRDLRVINNFVDDITYNLNQILKYRTNKSMTRKKYEVVLIKIKEAEECLKFIKGTIQKKE